MLFTTSLLSLLSLANALAVHSEEKRATPVPANGAASTIIGPNPGKYTFTVEATGPYAISATGGSGGAGTGSGSSGGVGGRAYGIFTLTLGTTYTAIVGGRGGAATAANPGGGGGGGASTVYIEDPSGNLQANTIYIVGGAGGGGGGRANQPGQGSDFGTYDYPYGGGANDCPNVPGNQGVTNLEGSGGGGGGSRSGGQSPYECNPGQPNPPLNSGRGNNIQPGTTVAPYAGTATGAEGGGGSGGSISGGGGGGHHGGDAGSVGPGSSGGAGGQNYVNTAVTVRNKAGTFAAASVGKGQVAIKYMG